MRALPFVVGLSMAATGLLGTLAIQPPSADRAAGPGEINRVPLGSRLLVRGLLERVQNVSGGASVGVLADCAGLEVPVFFPKGLSPSWSWTLVLAEGTVEEYRGARELVVGDPAALRMDLEGAEALSPVEVAAGWRGLLCHEVGFSGRILWARVSEGDAQAVEAAVEAGNGELAVLIHLPATPALRVTPGAAVTFIGVVAANPKGEQPVIHVRA